MAIPRSPRSLSAVQQAVALGRVFPQAVVRVKPGGLVWQGVITPTPLSRDYTIRITYRVGGYPQVVVVDPALEPDSAGRLPHYYREGSLCVHEAHEWDRSMLIVDTILPWTSEWLAYYELWKRDGRWYGDGEPTDNGQPAGRIESPSEGEPRNRAARRRRQREEARRERTTNRKATGRISPSERPQDGGMYRKQSTTLDALREVVNDR